MVDHKTYSPRQAIVCLLNAAEAANHYLVFFFFFFFFGGGGLKINLKGLQDMGV